MKNAEETNFIGAEGVSHKFAIYGETLRQKDRIWTVLWEAYGTEGAILCKKKKLSGLEQSRGAHNNVNFYSVFLSYFISKELRSEVDELDYNY